MIRPYKNISPTIPASCYVDESAQIIGDVALGEHASIWMNAVLRGDVHSIRVGAYSNIQDCSVLHGMKEKYGVFIGEYVTVGHSVTLHGCAIEDRCLIGMGSIILNGARIGAGSIIAGGWGLRGNFGGCWKRRIQRALCGMRRIIWGIRMRIWRRGSECYGMLARKRHGSR